ncbi:MAG: hypothetical protein Q7S73_03010 [bacterium]|nr:hypothetical protein [bacterium]
MSEGLIKEKFSKLKIDSIVEYYVHRGFDIDDINKSLNYKLLYIETYNHLWWVMNKHYKNPLIIFLNKILGILYPLDGKNMFLVLEKPKI